MISICIPDYPEMKNHDFFMERCLNSIKKQVYKDYEIVITNEGKIAENSNAAIKKAKGDIIKILYMDDYLFDAYSLWSIVQKFKESDCKWLATGCLHDNGEVVTNYHRPLWNKDIHIINSIGSPSVIAFENKEPLLFDESLSWMLDADLYKRMYERYGLPTILDEPNVVIGVGEHQLTHTMHPVQKQEEVNYVIKKHE